MSASALYSLYAWLGYRFASLAATLPYHRCRGQSAVQERADRNSESVSCVRRVLARQRFALGIGSTFRSPPLNIYQRTSTTMPVYSLRRAANVSLLTKSYAAGAYIGAFRRSINVTARLIFTSFCLQNAVRRYAEIWPSLSRVDFSTPSRTLLVELQKYKCWFCVG